jgi:hypothetical protein
VFALDSKLLRSVLIPVLAGLTVATLLPLVEFVLLESLSCVEDDGAA